MTLKVMRFSWRRVVFDNNKQLKQEKGRSSAVLREVNKNDAAKFEVDHKMGYVSFKSAIYERKGINIIYN